MVQRELYTDITPSQIRIYDEDVPIEDDRKAGYNIGDLLNMPYLKHAWTQDGYNQGILPRALAIHNSYRPSILNEYFSSRPSDEIVPNIPRIQQSVDSYERKYSHLFSNELVDMIKAVESPDCLCVHLRVGDVNLDSVFMDKVKRFACSFKKVVFLAGVHLDQT